MIRLKFSFEPLTWSNDDFALWTFDSCFSSQNRSVGRNDVAKAYSASQVHVPHRTVQWSQLDRMEKIERSSNHLYYSLDYPVTVPRIFWWSHDYTIRWISNWHKFFIQTRIWAIRKRNQIFKCIFHEMKNCIRILFFFITTFLTSVCFRT